MFLFAVIKYFIPLNPWSPKICRVPMYKVFCKVQWDGPWSQGTCILVNKINMQEEYKTGWTKGHSSAAVAIQRWLVTVV